MTKMQYCMKCGALIENNEVDHCPVCHYVIDRKEHLFRYYLLRKMKSAVKEDVEDKTYHLLVKYLKSHIYGMILSITVVAAVVSEVVTISNQPHVEKLEYRPAAEITPVSPIDNSVPEENTTVTNNDDLKNELNQINDLLVYPETIVAEYVDEDFILLEYSEEKLQGISTAMDEAQKNVDEASGRMEKIREMDPETLDSETNEKISSLEETIEYLGGDIDFIYMKIEDAYSFMAN